MMPLRNLFYSALLAFFSLTSPAIAHEAVHHPDKKVEHPHNSSKPVVVPTTTPPKPTKVVNPVKPPELPVNPPKKLTPAKVVNPVKPPELPVNPPKKLTPTKINHPTKPPELPVKPSKKPPKSPIHPAKQDNIKVIKAEFGVFRRDKRGKTTFIPTNKVPLEAGLAYGWRLQLKNYKGKVTWKEIFRLPQLPHTWGTQNGENFSLSNNGTAAVTTRTDKVKKGIIKNSWTVTSGDPQGNHLIEVYIDDRHVASFEFKIVKPNKKS